MWPVGTRLKVVRTGGSGHAVKVGSIVTLGGVQEDTGDEYLVYSCVVDPKDMKFGTPHSCDGFFNGNIGRNFYRHELEPLVDPDEEDLYV